MADNPTFEELFGLDDKSQFPSGEHDATFAWFRLERTTNDVMRLLLRFDLPSDPDRSAWLGLYEKVKGNASIKLVSQTIPLMADLAGIPVDGPIDTLEKGGIMLQEIQEKSPSIYRIKTFQHMIDMKARTVRTDVIGFVTRPIEDLNDPIPDLKPDPIVEPEPEAKVEEPVAEPIDPIIEMLSDILDTARSEAYGQLNYSNKRITKTSSHEAWERVIETVEDYLESYRLEKDRKNAK